MLKTRILSYDDLTPDQQSCQPENGSGKEYASYLVVYHNGKIVRIESDAMQPEDVKFYRDLSWVEDVINEAYRLGVKDGRGIERMKSVSTNKKK